MFEASGHAQDRRAMVAKTYVANSWKFLWQLDQRPAVSGTSQLRRSCMLRRLGVASWISEEDILVSSSSGLRGTMLKWRLTQPFSQPSSTNEMLLKWINEADRLETIERNDLSALPRERAVLAKQLMSSKRDAQTDYQLIALVLHDSVNDTVGRWNWLQNPKRGVSLTCSLSASTYRRHSSTLIDSLGCVDGASPASGDRRRI